MAGATWNERQPTDWLASNGKWYSSSSYPRGWSSTALPPAPGHGGVASVLKKYTKVVSGVQSDLMDRVSAGFEGEDAEADYEYEDDYELHEPEPAPRPSPRAKTPPPPSWSTGGVSAPPPPASGFSVAKSGRTVAPATVTSQRDYAEKLSSGVAPPPPLGSGDRTPSPGRVSGLDAATAPRAPTPANAVEPAAPPGPQSLDVVAGDLGKVLGSARKKIQQALNDNYEGQ